jgi:chloramphenicol-sensitive protein RarD
LTAHARSRNLRDLSPTDQNAQTRTGVIATTSAFVLWGLFPIFWKQFSGVNSLELIAHRITWSLIFLIPIVIARGTWGDSLRALRNPAAVRVHLLSGALLTVNWLVFVWAVNEGRIVETALGYFLTPLVNVAFGMIFLRERLRTAQGVALAIATAGVVLLIVRLGQFPWVALALAATFGSYGLLRKQSTLGSLSGLMLETTLMLPLALGFLAWRHFTGVGALGEIGAVQTTLVISSGAVTAVPLLLFAQGARLIQLSTVGLLQYIAPSVQFAIGVLIYSEPMPPERMWAFALIWAALAIYSADSVWASRRAGQEMR